MTRVFKDIKDRSVTPQKFEKASKDGKGKMEVSDEGGGRIVISEESAICKISSNKKDEPESVSKVVETDKGSSGTPQKVEKAGKDGKGKMEVSDEGGGRIVISEESAICKISSNKKDEPESVPKVVEQIKGAVGLQKRQNVQRHK